MTRRVKFDRFMVDVENGGNLKLARLTDAEYRCHFAGVLPIAAKSPIRGCLLVGDSPATAADIAFQARKPVKVAAAALVKLREVGILQHDAEYGCDRVHDFEEWNPPPKTDKTAAERQARRREKLKAERDGHGPVTAASRRDGTGDSVTVTPPEVEGERETPPFDPPASGGRPALPTSRKKRDLERHRLDVAAWSAAYAPHLDLVPADVSARWDELQGRLAETVSEGQRDLWLSHLHAHRLDGGTLVLGCPPEHEAWILDRFRQVLGGDVVLVPCEHKARAAA